MKIYESKKLSTQHLKKLLQRPLTGADSIRENVNSIILDVKTGGIISAVKYAKKFDHYNSASIFVSESEFKQAEKSLPEEGMNAIKKAYENIYNFHLLQLPKKITTETQKGILCSRIFKPIENVGLYIPGGTAVLPSTILMLGIPAKIAGCKRVVISTPVQGSKVNSYLLYAAKLCGISEIIKIGGAQGVGLLAYGGKGFRKVDKIFGPGNRYVTTAKLLVNQDFDGAQIDMPAGPSEVLIIADRNANPKFVASDLLSQAEHGADSQVILLTNDLSFAKEVQKEVQIQLNLLPRKSITEKSLRASRIIITNDIYEGVILSNEYAPEHLILNVKNPIRILKNIRNAGSVFIGQYSPESAGDYASGTNHSLPTNGLAKTIGGVTVEMFMKSMTIQKLSKKGLSKIADTIIALANIEGLEAHANAIKVRMKK